MTQTATYDELLEQFEQALRDGSPVFNCCRRMVTVALDNTDLVELLDTDVTTRVTTLRDAVEKEHPGHLDGHRCCVGHLADVAFDLPGMLVVESTNA